MDKTNSSETPELASARRHDDSVDRRLERRAALRDRHAGSLTRLMEQRQDLRGVHALADLVDDAIRWTA